MSEIRVPGSQERLWLGTYSTPEAAAVARDVAFYCLRRPPTFDNLNFPIMLPAGVHADMSPRSIQRAASDAGMAVDAQFLAQRSPEEQPERKGVRGDEGFVSSARWGPSNEVQDGEALSISIEDYL